MQTLECFAEELFTWTPTVRMLNVVRFIFLLGLAF